MANNEQFLLDRGIHGKVGSQNAGLWLMGGRSTIAADPNGRRENAKTVILGNWYSNPPIVTLGLFTGNNNPISIRMISLNANSFQLQALSSTLDGKAKTSYLKYPCYVNWISLGPSYVPISSD